MRYVCIMAGGSGTRLWPLSRQGMPKQLLKLVDGKSLLRLAYERVAGLIPDENILICTGARYMTQVAEQLPELPVANLLGEPVGRDSLNAVAWPAAILQARDETAVVAMLSADHIIEPVDAFRAALEQAYETAEIDADALVTLGVVPTSPHTGFGYLHRGAAVEGTQAFHVKEFREKPDVATAQAYLDSGEYWWNAGMFVWRTSTLLRQLELLLPETHAAIVELAAAPQRLEEIYPMLHKTSVDYGVMEPVSRGEAEAHVVAVALPIDWRDIGGYAALADYLTKDADGNAIEGLVAQLDGHGNLLLNRSDDEHLVATVGCQNMIVVRTEQVTLVCPMSEAQRVKELVGKVGTEVGEDYA